MFKGLLSNLNLDSAEFKAVLQMTTEDIKFNNINFNKRTSLQDVINIAEKSAVALRRCIDIDGTTIYNSITGETIGDITELSLEEINKLLEG